MITLLITVALNVWGKGIMRASCALIGMIVGYGCALPLDTELSAHDELVGLTELPPLQLPHVGYFAWSFDTMP